MEQTLSRGDIVAVSVQGDFRVRRPALVMQSDLFAAHPSFVILPITDELLEAPLFRIGVDPTDSNGLLQVSQIMVDKPQTLARTRIGEIIGKLDGEVLQSVDRALLVFLGFA